MDIKAERLVEALFELVGALMGLAHAVHVACNTPCCLRELVCWDRKLWLSTLQSTGLAATQSATVHGHQGPPIHPTDR